MSAEIPNSPERPFVTEKKWPNGFTLLLHHMPYSQLTAGRLALKAGPRYETPRRVGVHHYIEHLLADGTAKHPNFHSLFTHLSRIGMDYAYETDFDQSVYSLKTRKVDSSEIVPYFADLVERPRFYKKDRLREEKIVNGEILEYIDAPDEHVDDMFMVEAYKLFPVGTGILGKKESLALVKARKIVEQEFRKVYRPDNMVLALAGNFNEAEIIKQVDQTFGKLVNHGPSKLNSYPTPIYTPNGRHIVIKNRELEQVQVLLGFPIEKDLLEKHYYAIDLLALMVAKSIHFKLIEKYGKGYQTLTAPWIYSDFGAIRTKIAVKKRDVPFVIETMAREIREQRLDQEEISLIKDRQKGIYTRAFEGTAEIAEHMTESYFSTGKILSLEQLELKVDAVQEKTLRDLHEKIFTNENAILAMLGPISRKDAPKHQQKLQ